MVKKKLCLLFFLFLSGVLLGQGTDGKLGPLFVGARLGGNICFMQEGFFNYTRIQPGFSGGLYVGYSLSDQLSVSFEPSYSQFGINKMDPAVLFYTDIEEGFLKNISEMDLLVQTFSFPVIGTFYMGSRGMKPKIFAGASYDFNHWAKTRNTQIRVNELTGEPVNVTSYTPVDNRIQDHGVSAILGLGANMDAGGFILSLDLRYVFGFDNLNAVQTNHPLHNRALIATLGFGL